MLKADPFAFAAEVRRPARQRGAPVRLHLGRLGLAGQARHDWLWRSPVSIYEVHLGSWRQGLGYRELAEQLADYVEGLGFTHVELMPDVEHPCIPLLGLLVTFPYAPTSRFGSPDDFKVLRRPAPPARHQRDRRLGQPTSPRTNGRSAASTGPRAVRARGPARRASRLGLVRLQRRRLRNEVRNFLVFNALYWLEEFHLDGLRIDAVASMLYLDYSREAGEWSPNRFGGNEDLESVGSSSESTGSPTPATRGSSRSPRSRPPGMGSPGRSARRPRVRLQVEHGLDARHARLLRLKETVTAGTTTTS